MGLDLGPQTFDLILPPVEFQSPESLRCGIGTMLLDTLQSLTHAVNCATAITKGGYHRLPEEVLARLSTDRYLNACIRHAAANSIKSTIKACDFVVQSPNRLINVLRCLDESEEDRGE